MEKRRIGIMGGTFSPIHNAHLYMAESARIEYNLDRVIFIPSGVSYLKKDIDMPDGNTRFNLVKRAIEDNPFFTVSRIEIDRPGDTYTIETLEQLSELYPGDEFYFIVGADSLNMIDKWVRFDEILSSCTLLAMVRDESDSASLDERIAYLKSIVPSARIDVIHAGRIDISSTMIRERIKNGISVKYLLPDKCIEYIAANNLYCGEKEKDINELPDKIIGF